MGKQVPIGLRSTLRLPTTSDTLAGAQRAGWPKTARFLRSYQLCETPSDRYAERTEWNIRDSDATVVFSISVEVHGGTALTLQLAKRLGKPWLHLARDHGDNGAGEPSTRLCNFLQQYEVTRLNVAGPRQSRGPEIGEFVNQVLAGNVSPEGLTTG